ncbi:Hypothetical predicted protein [Cloeon dipterum]|uniref:C2H2-type domain-containing protein n=1 Tax=Cloeon dipterum TaxID=197152 RepID=A0A8S1D2K1_9INSE|nr:Hypothetical predicted protein [Cloeon dipterum]
MKHINIQKYSHLKSAVATYSIDENAVFGQFIFVANGAKGHLNVRQSEGHVVGRLHENFPPLLARVRKMLCGVRGVLRARRVAGVLCRTAASEVGQPLTADTVLADKYEKKRTQAKPFAKELFLGRVDYDLFAYPEVLDPERLQTLNEMVAPIEKFFNERLDSRAIDREAKIPPEVLNALKEMGLFGQQIPEEFGGLGLNATEFARIAEVTALDGSVAVTLAAHQSIGLKGLLICGTEEQKRKYLPRLATGEWVAAFCLTEPSSGSDAASIQTRATLDKDGKTWRLNGGKIWISNGGIADFFTVFAKTEQFDEIGQKEDKVTAFVVERGFGGITSGKPEDKLGIRGSNTTEVHFDNTPIPMENVLGEVGGGFKVAMNILNSGRFSMGSSSAGVLKKLIKLVTTHATERKQFGKQLKEFGLIKEKVAKLSVDVYAMESMAYMTAGILDLYDNPDCAMEAAMVKVYSSEAAWTGVSECLQILGGLGYMKDYPYERYLRDSRIMMIFEGTNEIMRIFISLLGLQHAGAELSETVRKARNPLLYPGYTYRLLRMNFRHTMDAPKMNLRLKGYTHPSLEAATNNVEYCVLRLQYATMIVLQRYGKGVIDAQLELRRVADIAINVYAAFASVSRASRSYCIGLHNAEYELVLAQTVALKTLALVKQYVGELEVGPLNGLDQAHMDIGKKLHQSEVILDYAFSIKTESISDTQDCVSILVTALQDLQNGINDIIVQSQRPAINWCKEEIISPLNEVPLDDPFHDAENFVSDETQQLDAAGLLVHWDDKQEATEDPVIVIKNIDKDAASLEVLNSVFDAVSEKSWTESEPQEPLDEVQQFECLNCNETFSDAGELEAHRAKNHTLPTACDLCGKVSG